ncbi:hypothetical protein RYX36_037330 [Vicia faba]
MKSWRSLVVVRLDLNGRARGVWRALLVWVDSLTVAELGRGGIWFYDGGVAEVVAGCLSSVEGNNAVVTCGRGDGLSWRRLMTVLPIRRAVASNLRWSFCNIVVDVDDGG